jgi:hypothetical protein
MSVYINMLTKKQGQLMGPTENTDTQKPDKIKVRQKFWIRKYCRFLENSYLISFFLICKNPVTLI